MNLVQSHPRPKAQSSYTKHIKKVTVYHYLDRFLDYYFVMASNLYTEFNDRSNCETTLTSVQNGTNPVFKFLDPFLVNQVAKSNSSSSYF